MVWRKSRLLPKLNILLSYYYIRDGHLNLMRDTTDFVDYAIDSGAYSAFSSGKAISMDEYQTFLTKLGFNPFGYFALDVIGDEKATMVNYRKMRADGFKPIPIFTRGSDPSLVDELFADTDFIGYGGISARKGNSRTITYGYVKKLMSLAKGRKVHWLGFAILNYIKYFKPFSFDSTSWSAGLQYGAIPMWFNGAEQRITRLMFMARPSDHIRQMLEHYEEDIGNARFNEEWRCKPKTFMVRVSAKAVVKKALDIQRETGTRFFISVSTVGQMEDTIAAYKFWAKKLGKGIHEKSLVA